MLNVNLPMTREEYNELRARAHEMMLDDYKWMLDQESGIREWRCPKRWIIEFVHDVSDYVMVRSSGEEDVGDGRHHLHAFRVLAFGVIRRLLHPCAHHSFLYDDVGRELHSLDVSLHHRLERGEFGGGNQGTGLGMA